MSMKRGRSGHGEVRKVGRSVGPEYAEENFANPWNMGIDHEAGSESEKTLSSPTSTFEGPAGGHDSLGDYDKLWEGK